MMDASQIAAAARATAEKASEAARVARSMPGGQHPANVAEVVATSWERFASEIERIDATT